MLKPMIIFGIVWLDLRYPTWKRNASEWIENTPTAIRTFTRAVAKEGAWIVFVSAEHKLSRTPLRRRSTAPAPQGQVRVGTQPDLSFGLRPPKLLRGAASVIVVVSAIVAP